MNLISIGIYFKEVYFIMNNELCIPESFNILAAGAVSA